MHGHQLYNPTVKQAEEEENPHGCECRWACIGLVHPEHGSDGKRENS